MLLGLLSRRGPVRVQPFFGYRNAQHLYLNARATRAREPVFEARSFWRDFATMLGEYASREVPGLEVELEYDCANGKVIRGKRQTGPEGFVRFDLPIAPACPPAPRTRWERATLRWRCPDRGDPGEAHAYILAPGGETRMGIISDVDDTILETGITGNFRAIARNWKRVFAQMPSERVLVPGATGFFAALGGNPQGAEKAGEAIGAIAPQARVRPVFYVSSSPWNLFSYLVTFKRERGLPLGPVMLRDWGFNRRTLGKEGHGSHKLEAIRRILETFPQLSFALIGDDTQRDLLAFGSIARDHPDRIAAVFIREVAGAPLTDEEIRAKAAIEGAGVPFWTGSDYRAAASFLKTAGLEFEGGVEGLVRTASEGQVPHVDTGEEMTG
ncbi:MAG: phosphatase domain-containing protein [Erythrobacter sp.]|jgi:phosphatidate phosphatase APP1|nr:phosphatase domain-containing protein [Erythrobacter sp.]